MLRLLAPGVLFLGLVERGGQAAAFGIGFGEARLDLAELGAGRGQRVFAFGQPAGEAGDFVERLSTASCSERFSSSSSASFSRAPASSPSSSTMRFSARRVVLQGAPVFAQRAALAGFLRQPGFELGDLGRTCGNFVGHGAGAFSDRLLARQLDVLARSRPRFERLAFSRPGRIRRAASDRRARFIQHAGEAERLRFFLLERAQRGVERSDQLIEGLLRSSSSPILRPVSLSRLRSASFSSPMREPMSDRFSTLTGPASPWPFLAFVGGGVVVAFASPALRLKAPTISP